MSAVMLAFENGRGHGGKTGRLALDTRSDFFYVFRGHVVCMNDAVFGGVIICGVIVPWIILMIILFGGLL
jgi:hypothetical protein